MWFRTTTGRATTLVTKRPIIYEVIPEFDTCTIFRVNIRYLWYILLQYNLTLFFSNITMSYVV